MRGINVSETSVMLRRTIYRRRWHMHNYSCVVKERCWRLLAGAILFVNRFQLQHTSGVSVLCRKVLRHVFRSRTILGHVCNDKIETSAEKICLF